MNFRSLEDLDDILLTNISRLPKDFDLIVGIPRSGLLVANLLALYMNLPFTDLESFLENRILSFGRRVANSNARTQTGKVLVVDDSILTGSEMHAARKQIQSRCPEFDSRFLAVYVTHDSKTKVDFWFDVCDTPRIFQWNLLNHELLGSMCFDLDGILCRDPTEVENDDGERYVQYLSTAVPHLRPARKIGYIVTARLEKYRDQTEAWLNKHQIEYGELIMLDAASKEERIRGALHTKVKAQAYRRTGALLFVESSSSQAEEISRLSGKPVLSTEEWEMIRSSGVSLAAIPSKVDFDLRRSWIGSLIRWMRRAARRLKKIQNRTTHGGPR